MWEDDERPKSKKRVIRSGPLPFLNLGLALGRFYNNDIFLPPSFSNLLLGFSLLITFHPHPALKPPLTAEEFYPWILFSHQLFSKIQFCLNLIKSISNNL
jgi:hypothetical protein